MASIRAFFNRFLLLLIHLGCFPIFSAANPNPSTQQDQQQPEPRRRKITPLSPPTPSSSSSSNLKPQKSFSRSVLSYLSRLLSRSSNNDQPQQHCQQPTTAPPSPLQSVPLSPPTAPPAVTSSSSSTLLQHDRSLATARRDDIFPCSACGEVLAKPQLLELHQATKHSLSELRDVDSGKNIVQIIFHSGWSGGRPPVVHRILRIHNSPKTLARFEEYREVVRSRAARNRGAGDERCIADGNERLRFYCSTVLCALGRIDGPSHSQVGACGSPYCSACGIVRHGFAGKQVGLDGIATHATGWGAHVSLPEELEREFAFLHVRRAVLVCRVVAGRVARGGEEEEEEKGAAFDSVVPVPRMGHVEEEELLVFNPRAVLPCFVIVYSA